MAEVAFLVASPRKGVSTVSVSKNPKTMLPSMIDDIGGSHSAPSNQVSPPHNFRMSSIAEPYNPTNLLIFNVHGISLDTSLLIQPNPNCNIRVQAMDDGVFVPMF